MSVFRKDAPGRGDSSPAASGTESLQPPDRISARIIEDYGALIESPVLRLRFIRRAVARCQAEQVGVRSSRWPLYDRFRVRKLVVDELVPLLPDGRSLPPSVRLARWAFKLRVPLYALVVCSLVAALGGAGVGAYRAVARWRERALASAAEPQVAATGEGGAGATPPVGGLPAYAPEQIWLVESGDGYELFSNGARILTEFQTSGEKRHFYAFPRADAGPDGGLARDGAPVGIVFHTSQSHIAPFSPEYNEKLQTSSRALLEYVRDHKLYNYVIDRFGRIYRIVPDDEVADHAGNSVWADDEALYLNLSSGFIGVCFEATWTTETKLAADQINEAQIYAGRALTGMLRSQHRIADADCVTHAIVSVSPASQLIGFHTDWGRNFPFAALDLSDKYDVPTPSIVEFGFGHDASFDRTIGGTVWPGIAAADADLAARAAERGETPQAFRRALQDRYSAFRVWLARHGGAGAGDGE